MSLTPTLEEDTPPASPTHRQTAQDDVCCVCLEALQPEARGAQRAVPIPTCNRHGMHLECMAQWRVEAASGQPLQCPLCQNGHHRHGNSVDWLPEHDEQLAALCIEENVPPPTRRGGTETAQIQVRDYAVRTFARQDAPEPPAPIHITVSCCSGMVPTGSRLWTYRAERCRSALLPAEGMQASLTGRPLGRVRAVAPSHPCTKQPCRLTLAPLALRVAASSTGTGTSPVNRVTSHATAPHLPHDIVEVVTSEEEVPVTPAPPPPPLASPPPTQEPPTSPLRADRAGWYERGPPNVRAPRAPAALRHASRAGWERRWWGMLSCAQQTAVASTLLGNIWRSPAQPCTDEGPQLSAVLQLADSEEPSRLPLRS
eukprot:symbB.v1.2.011117.t1/scaffold739.1/size166688/8